MEQKEKNTLRNLCAELCLGLLVYLPLTISYGALLGKHSSRYRPCPKTSSTYQWCFITLIFLIIGTIFSVVVPPLLYFFIKSLKESSAYAANLILNVLMICRLLLAVFALVCFGGLCYAIGQNDKCKDLSGLVIAYIILVSIGLFIVAGLGIFIWVAGTTGGTSQPQLNEAIVKQQTLNEAIVKQQTGGDERNREENNVSDVKESAMAEAEL